MKFKHLLPMAPLACIPFAGDVFAEDIDIFPSSASQSSASNLLIMVDNGANWASQVGNTWSSNLCGTGGAAFCYLKDALVNVLSGLSTDKQLNVGVMLGSNVNTGGGYVRVAMRDISNADNRAALIAAVNSFTNNTLTTYNEPLWPPQNVFMSALSALVPSAHADSQNNSCPGTYSDKVGSSYTMSLALDEAYRYFNGMNAAFSGSQALYTNSSDKNSDFRDKGTVRAVNFYFGNGNNYGKQICPVKAFSLDNSGAYTSADATTYKGVAANQGCGRNYILYIGNGLPSGSSESTANNDAAANFTGYTPLAAPAVPGYYGDSFTNYMNSAASTRIKTYTIDIAPATTGQGPNNTRLLQNMAAMGGGTYSSATNSVDLINQIKAVFNQIQASDAAFASVSLPVSVNVRGSFLNQVYMGQFRPDTKPRWFGNLKLYQLAPDSNGNVWMVDKTGTTKVESQTTGFIVDEAISFWTDPSNFWNYRCTGANGAALTYTSDLALLCGNPISGSDSPDGAVVEKGGAGQRLRDAFAGDATNSSRKVYTYPCANPSCSSGTSLSSKPFDTGTIDPGSNANQAAFGTSNASYSDSNTGGAAQSGELTDLVNWVRGVDNTSPTENTSKNSPYTIGPRPSIEGDVLHSRPVVVSYNKSASGCADSDNLDKDVVVFHGANDGLLHATLGGPAATSSIISPNTPGKELWAFTPSEFFGYFKRLRDNSPPIVFPAPVSAGPSNKSYLIDGNVTTYTQDGNGDCKLTSGGSGDKAYLFFTLRRGGRFIYALDILDPVNPKFLWKRSYTDTALDSRWAELGQTWSQITPVLTGNPPSQTLALIFGAGYDPGREDRPYNNGSYGTPAVTSCNSPNVCMGRGVFVVNATTGAIIKLFGTADGMTNNSVPSDVYVIKNKNSGSALQAYVGDTGGNIWKMDLMDHLTNPANPTPTADTSKWTVTQLASLGDPTDTTHTGPNARKFLYYFDAVAINGGYALLGGTGDREKPADTTVHNRFYMIKDSTTISGYPIRCEGNESNCDALLINATDTTATVPGNAKGWYIELGVGEKTVGSAATVDSTTFFPTNEPSANAPNVCINPNLGVARLYAINYLSGAPTVFGTRSARLAGGGLPPSPIAVMVQLEPPTPPNGSTSGTPQPVSTKKLYQTVCSGPHCVNPGPITLERRNFVYWYQEKLD